VSSDCSEQLTLASFHSEALPTLVRSLGRRQECGALLQSGHDPRETTGGAIVQDAEVLSHIDQLAREEHELWDKESRGDATEEDRLRLKRIQVTLDQCWDYLNQRRALRDAHRSPEEAKVRDADTVERYVR